MMTGYTGWLWRLGMLAGHGDQLCQLVAETGYVGQLGRLVTPAG